MQIILASVLTETTPLGVPLKAASNVSFLKKKGFKDVELVSVLHEDAAQNADTAELLVKEIQKHINGSKQTAVFITYTTKTIKFVIKAAELVKKQQNFAPVLICFGADNQEQIQHCKGYEVFDYVITGEPEVSSAELLQNLRGTQKTVFITGKPANPEDLPSPWLDGTLDPVDYNGAVWELSRGCGQKCPFCANHKERISLPLSRLEKELELFAKKKVPEVFVEDKVFNADKERALKLLSLMQKKLPDAHFQFKIDLNLMDKQLVRAFCALSCSLQINLISSNPTVLKNCGISFDKKQFAHKIRMLNDNELIFGFNLIYGLPGDTYPSFRETLDYALSLYPNHLEIHKLSLIPGTKLSADIEKTGIRAESEPPFHIQVSPTFSELDLLKAENLAFACTVFYTAGRAVPWFLSVIHPLKIKPSQFFSDFAEWLRCNNCAKSTGFDPFRQPHTEIEKIQLLFLELKYEEKRLSFAFPVVKDVVCLNGALSRLFAEGEETTLRTMYHPDDILGGSAFDVTAFAEEACAEPCTVRVFNNNGSPDFQII
ncbi:MAG: radical SAM protein [Spirochaetaceae bacterium]|nr:radical SAM protein [Spirochaetaceae bacterium]